MPVRRWKVNYSKIIIQVTLSGLLMLSASAFGRGPADKVTGDFAIAGCFECVPGDPLGLIRDRYISAHEASGRRAQKGFLFSVNSSDSWYEIDFRDTENTCVNVFADGEARIGGLVSDGNVAAVGKYFGYAISDGGQPDRNVYSDTMWVIRFDGSDTKSDFFNWCLDIGPVGPATWWPQAVVEGNVKVHNYEVDGD